MILNNVYSYNEFSKEDLLEWSVVKSMSNNPCYLYGKIIGIDGKQGNDSNIDYFDLRVKTSDNVYELSSMGFSNYNFENNGNKSDDGFYINNKIFDLNMGDNILVHVNKGSNYIIDLEDSKSIKNDFQALISSQTIPICEKSDIGNLPTSDKGHSDILYYGIIICTLIIIGIIFNIYLKRKK